MDDQKSRGMSGCISLPLLIILACIFTCNCMCTCIGSATIAYYSMYEGYYYPMPGHTYVSSSYGPRDPVTVDGQSTSSFHNGTDFPATTGTIIHAIHGGTVSFAGDGHGSGGIFVRIKFDEEIENEDGTTTTSHVVMEYLHCSKVLVASGDEILAGQPIALSGNTGISTGPHLHLAIYIDGETVDPELLLQPWPDELTELWADWELPDETPEPPKQGGGGGGGYTPLPQQAPEINRFPDNQ